MPRHRLVQQGGVEHGPPERPRGVKRGGEGHHPVAGGAAVGRLGADDPADRGRLADRAAGVGAERERRLVGGDGGGRAAGGAARHPGQVPRVMRGAVAGVLGRGAHRELVHVGLADEDGAGLAQPPGDGRLVGRVPALEDLRPAGGGRPDGGEQVLHRDRDPGQGAERLARRPPAVHRAGLRQRVLGVHVQERPHVAVYGGDPVQVRLGDFGRRHASCGHRGGQLGRGHRGQIVHRVPLTPRPGSSAP